MRLDLELYIYILGQGCLCVVEIFGVQLHLPRLLTSPFEINPRTLHTGISFAVASLLLGDHWWGHGRFG